MLLIAVMLCLQSDAQAPVTTPAAQFEEERLQSLMGVRRIYVDKLVGSSSDQIRDLLMSSLQVSKVFIITENPQRADATLRGTAEDLIYSDQFQSSEGINARGAVSDGEGAGKTRKGSYAGISVGDHESTRIVDRRHEAVASLRLVNKDGDIIWSSTQLSKGAKFRSAAADVADKIAKQLVVDYERGRKGAKLPVGNATPNAASK